MLSYQSQVTAPTFAGTEQVGVERGQKCALMGSIPSGKAFPGALAAKSLPASAGDRRDAGLIPMSGRERLLTAVFLPGESQWTEAPGGLQSIGSQRAGHDSSDLARRHACIQRKE